MAQNLWADIHHSLGYKNPFTIPDVVKRKIYRLAAMTEVIDDGFLSIKSEIELYKLEARKALKSSVPALPINRETLIAYYEELNILAFDSELANGLASLNQSRQFTLENVSKNLHLAGISDLQILDTYIKPRQKSIIEFARKRLKSKYMTLSKGIFFFYVAYHYVCSSGNENTVQQYLINTKIDYSAYAGSLALARDLLQDFKDSESP